MLAPTTPAIANIKDATTKIVSRFMTELLFVALRTRLPCRPSTAGAHVPVAHKWPMSAATCDVLQGLFAADADVLSTDRASTGRS